MKKGKLVALALAGMLMGTAALTGTLAWFTVEKELTNTFVVGDIDMELKETCNNPGCGEHTTDDDENVHRVEEDQEYKVLPGQAINKDPGVLVSATSEDCYLLVVIEDTLTTTDGISYTIDSAIWKEVTADVTNVELKDDTKIYAYSDATGVKVVEKGTGGEISIFDGITVDGELVTTEVLEALQVANPTIKVLSYAYQSTGQTFANALEYVAEKHEK